MQRASGSLLVSGSVASRSSRDLDVIPGRSSGRGNSAGKSDGDLLGV